MGQRLALIIGNNSYEDENLSSLRAPGADVENLARILRDPAIGSFDEVTTLINEFSSIVQRTIAYFFTRKKRDDLLLLYFSGHGILDDQGRLFLAVKDTSRDLPTATGIPAAFITDEMDRSRSQRQVLMLDCCHSGAFARGAKKALGASVGTAAAFEGTGFGRIVITATDSTQYAWEGDQVFGEAENSLFTHFLIQGLETGEADQDADGLVNLGELFEYIYEHVVTETSKQTPVKWGYKQRGEIIIARNPQPVKKEGGLPAELQQAIENPIPEVREGAVSVLQGMLDSIHEELALAALEALKKLAKDDSRRVSSAASAILEKHGKKPELKTEVAEETESETEGIVTADRRGIIRKVNPAAADIFGYRADELMGQNVSILMPSPYREEHDGYIANYLKTGNKKIIGIRREVVGRRKNGTIFPMDIAIEEIRIGGQLGFKASIQDITERKEAEKALLETLEAVEVAGVEPEQTTGQTETSQAEDEIDEFKTTETAEEAVLTQRKSQFAKFKAVWEKRKVLMGLLLGVITVTAFIWLRPGTSVDNETPPATSSNPADITTTQPPPGETEVPLPQSLVTAKNRLEQTRKQAQASQAGLYAPNIFESAKQKEEAADSALNDNNYVVAESLFLAANKEYRQSMKTASTAIAGLKEKVGNAREKAANAQTAALNDSANIIQTFHEAVSSLERGDRERKNGAYKEAYSAFTKAEELFKKAIREVAEIQATKADNAEQNALKARQTAENNGAKTSAEAAYDYALKKEEEGRQYLANKQYAAAISAFNKAVKGYEKSQAEKKAIESADVFYRKGDYEKSLEKLKNILSNPPYEGENRKARKQLTTVEAAKQIFDQRISEVRKAKNDDNLIRALGILNDLPEKEKNTGLVESLRNEIITSDHSAPVISHNKPKPYKRNESITLRAKVIDNVEVKQVLLNYKRKKEKEYRQKEMTLTGKNQYNASVSTNDHNGKEIFYYFTAKDSNGNETLYPANRNNPFKIRKEDEFVPPRPP